jgi:predicted DNA-binding transcriptional regulator AlpA
MCYKTGHIICSRQCQKTGMVVAMVAKFYPAKKAIMEKNRQTIYEAIRTGRIPSQTEKVSTSKYETSEYLQWVDDAQNETSIKFLGSRYKG